MKLVWYNEKRMKRLALAVMVLVVLSVAFAPMSNVMAAQVPEAKLTAVREQCDEIRDNLKALQRSDSRARVYLGRYYGIILSRFIIPLNVRLVKNSLSSSAFTENQNRFEKAWTSFTIDYIEYQKGLEELVSIDCRTEPERFYQKLTNVRVKRAAVEDDTVEIRKRAEQHVGLVMELMEGL